MTTIAWDGTTLASDSQSSSGDMVCTLREQKIFTPAGEEWLVNGEVVLAIGASDDCGIEPQLFDVMANNLTYKSEFTTEPAFMALAVTGISRVWVISKSSGNSNVSISFQPEAFAIGSGSTIALTAMHCGKTAVDAVKVAIELDVYSGGCVQSFTFFEEGQNITQE